MLRITMIRLKRAWSHALALRNRGDSRHPGKFHRLPMVRTAQKSTNLRKDTECQKCKQIIEYLFSPLRTSDEIKRIQSIIINDIKRMQKSLSDNSNENSNSHFHICRRAQQQKCIKCKKIINAIFGEENTAEVENVMTHKASIEETSNILSATTKQVDSENVANPKMPIGDPENIIATIAKQTDADIVTTSKTPAQNLGILLSATAKQFDSDKIVSSKTPYQDPERMLTITNESESESIANVKKTCGETSTLLSTTAKQTEEQLAQKIEIIEETPLVEAEKPKITGLNTPPRVLGNSEKDLCVAPELEIDSETVIRDNVRHTFEKIVRRLENTELLAGISPIQCSVVNCMSGGSNHVGSNLKGSNHSRSNHSSSKQPPGKSGDSSGNNKKSEVDKQNEYDAIAKRYLGTPSNKIDSRLVKEMKQLGVPTQPSDKKSSIEVRASKNPRKPSEKTVLELEARKSEPDLLLDNKSSKEKSQAANFQSNPEPKIGTNLLAEGIRYTEETTSETGNIKESRRHTFEKLSEKEAGYKQKPVMLKDSKPEDLSSLTVQDTSKSPKHLSSWTTKHPYYRDLSIGQELNSQSAQKNDIHGQNILNHASHVPQPVPDTNPRPPCDAQKALDTNDSKNIVADEKRDYDYLKDNITHSTKHDKNIADLNSLENITDQNINPTVKHIATDSKGSGYTTEQSVNYVVEANKQPLGETTVEKQLAKPIASQDETHKRPLHDAHTSILASTHKDEPKDSSPKEPTHATEQSVYYSVEDKNQSRKEASSKLDHQTLFKISLRLPPHLSSSASRDSQDWSRRQVLEYRKEKTTRNPTFFADLGRRPLYDAHRPILNNCGEKQRLRNLQKRKRKTAEKHFENARRMPMYYEVSPQMFFYPNAQAPPYPFPQNSHYYQVDPYSGQPVNQQQAWPKTLEKNPIQTDSNEAEPKTSEVFKEHALSSLYAGKEKRAPLNPNDPILNPYDKDYYIKNCNRAYQATDDENENVTENTTDQTPIESQTAGSYPAVTPQMYFYSNAQSPYYNQYGPFTGQWNVWSQNSSQEGYSADSKSHPHSQAFQKDSLSYYVNENNPENQYTNVEVRKTDSESGTTNDTGPDAKTQNMDHSGYSFHIPNSWMEQYPFTQQQTTFYQQPESHHRGEAQQDFFNANQRHWSHQLQNQKQHYMQDQTHDNDQKVDSQKSNVPRFPFQNPNHWVAQHPYFNSFDQTQDNQQTINPQKSNTPRFPIQNSNHWVSQHPYLQQQGGFHNAYFNADQNRLESEEGESNINHGDQYTDAHAANYSEVDRPEQENKDSQSAVQARPVEQIQGALYTAGSKDLDNQIPGYFQFPQQHGHWMNQHPYYQDMSMNHSVRYDSSPQNREIGSGRTMENMERRPPYDAHRPLTNKNIGNTDAEAEESRENESSENSADQPWLNQFPGSYPGVTPHGMFYPNTFPDQTYKPDPQHPYFHQNFTPYSNAGQPNQNEWKHPFSPEGHMSNQVQLYQSEQDSQASEQNEATDQQEDPNIPPGEKTSPSGPKSPPAAPSAAFISLPQGQWKSATKPKKKSTCLDTTVSPLPESVPLDESLPLSEILRRVRERSRLEYLSKWRKMDTVQGKCGRERPPCPPPQPVCPKAEPTPPPPCPPPPPPCPRPCKPRCPPPCIPPTPGCPPCPPCCKFESVSLGDTLYHIFTVLWDFGMTRLVQRRSISDTSCVAHSSGYATKAIMTDVVPQILGDNQFTTYGSDLGSYCWKLETLALARGFEPWVPVPSWPIPVKEEKKKLVCPKEGCKPRPPPRYGDPCERPCYPGNPCLGFPNTFRRN